MIKLLPTLPGVLLIAASFTLFRGLFLAAAFLAPFPPSIQDGPPRRRKWLYKNIAISLIHSTITAVLSVFCFFNEPAMLSDMIAIWTLPSFYLTCLSTGYFVHDFLDLALNDFNKSVSLLIHHSLVIGAFLIAIFSEMYLGYATCSLLMEVNSIFLHFRRILLFHDVNKKSILYGINSILMLITFVFFRFLTSAWMLNIVIKARNIIPASHVVYGSFSMFAMIYMNIALFSNLWRSDFGQDKKKRRAVAKESEVKH